MLCTDYVNVNVILHLKVYNRTRYVLYLFLLWILIFPQFLQCLIRFWNCSDSPVFFFSISFHFHIISKNWNTNLCSILIILECACMYFHILSLYRIKSNLKKKSKFLASMSSFPSYKISFWTFKCFKTLTIHLQTCQLCVLYYSWF